MNAPARLPLAPEPSPLLRVENLRVQFRAGTEIVDAVRGVSFTLDKGQTLALVGESGSGKTVTALSIPRLLPAQSATHPLGAIHLGGENILTASEARLRRIRAEKVAMIFQEPMTSLNPLHNISRQISEMLTVHQRLSKNACRARVLELLDLVGLSGLKTRLDALPHELSGGQRQRVMIAMAIANEPDLLIADEPTTALDVTVQTQILALLESLRDRFNMALLFITHDLELVRRLADDVCVMKDGLIVERAKTKDLFLSPSHPYTQALLAAAPSGAPPPVSSGAPEVLSVTGLSVRFPIRGGVLGRVIDWVRAVEDVSFSVQAGQTLGVVGESGSGKTTLGLALLRLLGARGVVRFMGESVLDAPTKRMRLLRRQMQIVFQDPYGSLSPRRSVGQIVGEGLDVHKIARDNTERTALVRKALEEVGLDPGIFDRFPHEFSGGQRQRISIARALVLKPKLIVLDEPTSALDVTIQAQIVDLLRKLQDRYGLAYVFISHDLRVVRALASNIIVMKDGRIVESADATSLFEHPQHPYTQALLAAALHRPLPGNTLPRK